MQQNERANIYKLANLAGRFCQFANLTCINLPTFHFGVQIFANLPIWFADFCKLANLTFRFLQTCQLDIQTFTYLLIWPADFCNLANLACIFLPTCQFGVQIFANLPNSPADISKLANQARRILQTCAYICQLANLAWKYYANSHRWTQVQKGGIAPPHPQNREPFIQALHTHRTQETGHRDSERQSQ